MRIVLFLNKDLEANIALCLLKPVLTGHSVWIYYSATVGSEGSKPADLVRLEHFEKSFVYDELAVPGHQQALHDDFEFFGEGFKFCPFQKCGDVNTKGFVTEMKALDPHLFISIRFGKIFRHEILQVPTFGVLNLHSAILPDYRGVLGTLHALKDGNTRIGCTLHTIPDRGIDTGDVIEIAKVDVDRRRSLFWHIAQLYPPGVKLISNALEEIEAGRSPHSWPQDARSGAYYSIPTVDDFEQLRKRGIAVISAADYQDIMSQFVFKSLSSQQKEHIAKRISEVSTSVTKPT